MQAGDLGFEGEQAGMAFDHRSGFGDFVARHAQIAHHDRRPSAEFVDGGAREIVAGCLVGEGSERGGDLVEPPFGGGEAASECIDIGRRQIRRSAAGQKSLDLVQPGLSGCLEARDLDPEAIGIGLERPLLDHAGAGQTAPDNRGHAGGGEQNPFRHPAAANVEKRQALAEARRRRDKGVPLCKVLVQGILDDPGVDEVAELLVHDLDLADRALSVECLVLAERGLPLLDDLGRVHDAQELLRFQQSSGFVHLVVEYRDHRRLTPSWAAVSCT